MSRSLEKAPAEHSRGIPKYLRLCRAIEIEIAAGELAPGDKLPAEAELAQALPASLGTVQRALGDLADRGLLVREHGRGTFVASPRIEDRLLWHLRFLDETGEVLPVWLGVQAVERASAAGPWSDFLGRHPFYVRVRRTMDVNHEFLVHNEFILPGPAFEPLLRLDPARLEGVALRVVISERFGVQTLRVSERIGFARPGAQVCRRLGLRRGSRVLVCHVLGFGFREAPVYFQRYYIPPNERMLETRERRP